MQIHHQHISHTFLWSQGFIKNQSLVPRGAAQNVDVATLLHSPLLVDYKADTACISGQNVRVYVKMDISLYVEYH
jgi:hypothetical protein